MKERTSLVSNSSTCSFIFVGFDVTNLAINEQRIYDEFCHEYRYMNHTENGSPSDDTKLLGVDITTWDDCHSPPTRELDIETMRNEQAINLDKIRKEFGIPGSVEARVYIGTRMC